VNEVERSHLRVLVDEARRAQLDAERRGKRALTAIAEKEQVAGSRAIRAAQQTHDPIVERLKVIARRGDFYLISVGDASARILDVGSGAPRLSEASDVHGLLARRAWSPYEGDPSALLATAVGLLER
jgi:hypothetical protein